MKSIKALVWGIVVGAVLIGCSGGVEDAYRDIKGDKSIYFSYNANGSAYAGLPSVRKCIPGDVVPVIAAPGEMYRAGYEFAGWNTRADGSGTPYAGDGTVSVTIETASVVLYAQWRRWTETWGGPGADTANEGVVVDNQGNCYIVGSTMEAIGGSVQKGVSDLLLMKRRPDGTREWVLQVGKSGDLTRGGNLALDEAGNIYVVGETKGDLGGTGAVTIPGRWQAIVLKVSPEGAIIWGPVQVVTDNAGSVLNQGIAVDSSHCFVSSKKYVDDGQLGYELLLTAKLPRNATSGNVTPEWVHEVGFAGSETDGGTLMMNRTYADGKAVAVDGAGGCYVVGGVFGDIDGSGATYNTYEVGGNNKYDALVVRLNASGSATWIYRFPSYGQASWLNDVAVDSDGMVVVGGGTDNPDLAEDLNASLFVKILDPSASGDPVRWSYQSAYVNARRYINGLECDGAGGIYVCGGTAVSLTAGALSGAVDAFVMRLRRSNAPGVLEPVFVSQYGSPGKEAWANAFAISGDTVYTVGLTQERDALGGVIANSLDAFATTALSE